MLPRVHQFIFIISFSMAEGSKHAASVGERRRSRKTNIHLPTIFLPKTKHPLLQPLRYSSQPNFPTAFPATRRPTFVAFRKSTTVTVTTGPSLENLRNPWGLDADKEFGYELSPPTCFAKAKRTTPVHTQLVERTHSGERDFTESTGTRSSEGAVNGNGRKQVKAANRQAFVVSSGAGLNIAPTTSSSSHRHARASCDCVWENWEIIFLFEQERHESADQVSGNVHVAAGEYLRFSLSEGLSWTSSFWICTGTG